MIRFIELHYKESGDAFMVNLPAISRVYTHNETGETRIALLEDKNDSKHDTPTECSRQSVYRVRETYEQIQQLIVACGGVVAVVDKKP